MYFLLKTDSLHFKASKLWAPRMILGDSVKVNSHYIQYIYVCSLQSIIKMWEIAKEMSFTLTKAL